MDYPFCYNHMIGEYVAWQFEGIARIERDPYGDWYLEGLYFEGMKLANGERRLVELPKHDPHYARLCEYIQTNDREDIADAWAIHEVEDGPARHGDEQYDLMVST